MDILILKTDIESEKDTNLVNNYLRYYYPINELSVDLGDKDKVMRITGKDLSQREVVNKVISLGFRCEELA